MHDRRRYIKYSEDHTWGSLSGLSAQDLTDEQLKKLSFQKLVEFSLTDKRAETIAGDRLLTADLDSIRYLHNIEDDEFHNMPLFVSKYNEYIVKREQDIENKINQGWSNDRSLWIRWSILNDNNKESEIRRLIGGKRAVVGLDQIDYAWLCKQNRYLANDTILYAVEKGNTRDSLHMLRGIDHAQLYRDHPAIGASLISNAFGAGGAVLHGVVNRMPKEVFLAILPKMFTHHKNVYMYALCHPDTPESYAIRALRAIAKKSYVPKIKTPISVAMLKELPPVMRLDILESIINDAKDASEFPFTDLDEEKLRHLLFTAVIRHTGRVEHIVTRFTKLKEYENERLSRQRENARP